MTLRCIAQRIRSSFVHVELPLVMVHIKGVDRMDEETSSSNRVVALYPLAAVRRVHSHLFVLVLTRGGPITFASGRRDFPQAAKQHVCGRARQGRA